MHLDDQHCSKMEKIAKMFSSYFSSVFRSSCSTAIPNTSFLYHPLSSISYYSVSDIESKLEELSNNTSSWPDGLPGFFLANIKSVIAFPLWIIFRRLLDDGISPDVWKMSSITQVHKTEEQDDTRNYRPISILSYLAKIVV